MIKEDMSKVGYKLFRVKKNEPGKLFPLYVFSNESIPVGEWLEAKEGPMNEKGKVQSKLGGLAYRPGWHINDEVPYVEHIYSKHNGKKYLRDDCVWCEVEYLDDINYQDEANKNGMHTNGKFVARDAYLKKIPENGYYRYKTSPQMYGEWIIAGNMKINRIMSDSEVEQMCEAKNLTPLKRYGE